MTARQYFETRRPIRKHGIDYRDGPSLWMRDGECENVREMAIREAVNFEFLSGGNVSPFPSSYNETSLKC